MELAPTLCNFFLPLIHCCLKKLLNCIINITHWNFHPEIVVHKVGKTLRFTLWPVNSDFIDCFHSKRHISFFPLFPESSPALRSGTIAKGVMGNEQVTASVDICGSGFKCESVTHVKLHMPEYSITLKRAIVHTFVCVCRYQKCVKVAPREGSNRDVCHI